MVQYASGSVRIPGLSGQETNFDDMISQLMKIEKRQVNKLLQWREDWRTRLAAFQEIRSELMNLQSALNKLNTMDKFLTKTASSTDDKILTATAGADAMNTTYEVQTKQLAEYATWTKDIGLSKKDDVIATEKGSFTYSYKGVYRTLTVPKGTTVEGLMNIINNDSKNPGVKAQMINSTNGIIFQLRGMDTGKDNTLVIRKTENLTGLDVNLEDTNYLDTENTATFTGIEFINPYSPPGSVVDPLADPPQKLITDSINDTGDKKTFIYTVDGKRHSINVDPGDTIDDLIDAINNETPGIASLEWDATDSVWRFKMEKEKTTYSFDWQTNSNGDNAMDTILGRQNPDGTWAQLPKSFGSPEAKLVDNGIAAGVYTFKILSSDGSEPHEREYTFEIEDDTTLRGLANGLSFLIGGQANVAMVPDPNNSGNYIMQVTSKEATHRLTVEKGTLDEFAYEPPEPIGDEWEVRQGKNALVKINGVPSGDDNWLEVASNTLKAGDVMPGITFNLKKADSTATITVANDTQAMMENIQSFVDAVNSFRTLFMGYTSYDEDKEVKDLEYAESQFEMQKGGILMGNYGMQIVGSRLKNAVSGNSTGFMSLMKDAEGAVLGGDIFSALSQIGITTNANQGETSYGLLEINQTANKYGSKSLQQALDEDPEAVARLFATKGEGKSNSDEFHYQSHISTVTQSGTYNVEYTMSDDGSYIASAYINGMACNIDQANGYITSMEGPSKGIVIQIGENDALRTYTGTVSIRDGKVNELLGLLEGSEGILGSKGTLKNLEKNYEEIIKGIEDKIKKEDDRLLKFERNMQLKFARLEEVLSKYSSLEKTLESQLAQLTSSK